MAYLACPCGNSISNCCNGDEMENGFISSSSLNQHHSDTTFFSFESTPGASTNMWKCDICDRMMVFDGWNDPVTRCMRRIATDAPPEDLAEMAHADGIIYNNLLFNEVDSHFTYAHEHKGAPEYAFWNEDVAHENLPPLSFEIMQHEVFNHENGRFHDWWYASLYDDYLVFYSPYDPERRQPPVKAWKRYKQVWPKEDEAG